MNARTESASQDSSGFLDLPRSVTVSAHSSASAEEPSATLWVRRWHLVAMLGVLLATLASSAAHAQTTPSPAVALRSELTWTPVYAGDPLRVRVFLSSPLVYEESLELLRRIEKGESPVGEPPPPSIQLPTDWQVRVSLRLVRIDPDNTRRVILEPASWVPFLRAQVSLPVSAVRAHSVSSREWLVPAVAAQLTNGTYAIETSWDGTGLLPVEQLPAGGVLTAQDLRFEVTTSGVAGPSGGPPTADHLARLAYAAYSGGNHAEARRLGTEALLLDSGNLQPDRLETHLLVARSALAVQDYAGAKSVLDQLAAQPGAGSLGEVLEQVRSRLESLAPRLRMFPSTLIQGSFRLELDTLRGPRYVTYQSTNMMSWLPIRTNLSLTNWITLPDLPTDEGSQYFFRATMLP